MKAPSVWQAVLLLALVWAVPPAAAAPVVSGFDSGLEGWTVTGDNEAGWSPGGGNPGGCLSVNDLVTGPYNLAIASRAYLGDWSALGAGDLLYADIYLKRLSGSPSPRPFIFRLVGPGGAARAPAGDAFYPAEDAWTRFSVSLSPADWTMESGTWSGLLAEVRTLYVAGEFVVGGEDCRIDNVHLSAAPSPVLAPCLAATFNGTDLEDWSFSNTGGVSLASGGNAGGYARVTDGSGTTQAIAPPSFHGDWSSLDGAGQLRIDIRVLSASGTLTGATDFVVLSGPGGSARAGLAAGEVPPTGSLWKTIEIPLQASSWTVTSGTWSGLLAEVTSVRMTTDLYDGGATVGLDNIARFASGCAEPDERITLHAPDLELCGHVSMEGLASVAADASSGELFGVIDRTGSTTGGLWGVTGPFQGVRLQAYSSPPHLILDDGGHAFVSEDVSGVVHRRAADGVSTLWVSGFHSGDDDPVGFCIAPPWFDGPAVDPGDVLVTDWGNNGADVIYAFSPAIAESEQLLLADPGNVDMYDMASGDSVVYVSDALSATAIKVLSPAGTLTSLPLQTPILDMVSITRDPALEQLYVASRAGGAVHRVTIASGAVELVASSLVGLAPCCLEFDRVRRVLWITDQGANRVHRLCSTAAVGVDRGTRASRPRLTVRPNPVRGVARVQLELPMPGEVRVEVLDLAGRRVREIAHGIFGAGTHALAWDGVDELGRTAAPGIYFVRAFAGNAWSARKVVRLPG